MESSLLSSLQSGASSSVTGWASQMADQLGGSGLLGQLMSWLKGQELSQTNRPIRLRIGGSQLAMDGVLMAHSIDINEETCSATSLRMRLLCVATRADLPYQMMLGQPIEVQLVTDRGELRLFSAIISSAVPGQSDGGVQVWMVEATDALTFMNQGSNSRLFLRHSVLDITTRLLSEWQQRSSGLARAFDFDLSGLQSTRYPVREMTFQWNESETAFLMRLWRKHGMAWGVRPGRSSAPHTSVASSDDTPCHTLVLFDDAMGLPTNAAGSLRYHQDGAAQQRDGITLWSPVGRVVPGQLERRTWDYQSKKVDAHQVPTTAQLGEQGGDLAKALLDSRIDPPHWGDSQEDYQRLGTLRMQHHEMVAAGVHGASGAREAAALTWVEVQNVPGTSALSPESRQYIFVQVRHWGESNLPKSLDARITGMFTASGWVSDRPVVGAHDDSRRYANTFKAIKRNTPIVPAFDATADWPSMQPMSAIVVCPEGEEVYCDEFGRVKIQFQGLRVTDNEHAQGAGSQGNDADSAHVRVAMPAANQRGGRIQLPRAGDEVLVVFVQGDPDKPLITHSLHSQVNTPPSFHQVGGLPGNRYESGNFVKEIGGNGFVQTRYDATPGQISYQAATSYKLSQLSLGKLYAPRQEGHAAPRGEGAELSTLGALSLRGQEGTRVTTEASHPTQGRMLARDQLIGLTQTLGAIAQQLGNMAQAHELGGLDMSKLNDWLQSLQQWEHGTNTEPDKKGGRKPIMALDSTAGTGMLSHNNLLLGAQSNIDAVSAEHVQLTAGQQIRQRAGQGWDAFAHQGGMTLTAAQGLVQIQAHADGIEMGATKRLHQYSLDSVLIEAPTIVLKTAGGQIALTESGITISTSGELQGKAASFNFGGGGGGGLNLPGMPTSSMQTDERCRVTYAGSGEPRPGLRYTAFSKSDGRQLGSGVTDEQGFTQAFSGVNIDAVRVVIHPEEGDQE